MFGNRLKLLRKENGYTLEELADMYNKEFEAGLNKGTLSKYEHNKQEPMISVVVNLASLFHVPIDYLLGKTDCKKLSVSNFKEESDIEKDLIFVLNKLETNDYLQYHNLPLSAEHQELLCMLIKHTMEIMKKIENP